MSMSDSASLHVHAIHPRVKLLPPGQHYAGERLVDLHRVDVFDPQRRLRQDFPRRRDRTGQHQHGVGPHHYLRHNARPLAEIELIGFLEVLQVWEGAGSALNRMPWCANPDHPCSNGGTSNRPSLPVRWAGICDSPFEVLRTERGIPADHSSIWRWVQCYAPELNKRCRRERKPTNGSWRGMRPTFG